jgi:SAM-dependent methyltransferase
MAPDGQRQPHRRGIEEARRDWTVLGRTDPLWAVLVHPGTKDGGWALDEFLATGRADVAASREWLAELGLPTTWDRALDFGCGVGRLSQALAGHAREVVGVDISAPMLDVARRIDQTDGAATFVHNDANDLAVFPDGHFDLIYCVLVLQHLPRKAIDGYLSEFLRVLRPGGTVVVQLPTRALWTAKGVIWRLVPFPLIRLAQRHLLHYPAPMRMTRVSDVDFTRTVSRLGGVVAGRMVDPSYAEDFVNTRYALRHR